MAESNGTAAKRPPDLAALLEQRQILEHQVEIAQLTQTKKLLEGLGPWGDSLDFGGQDLWDRLRRRGERVRRCHPP